MSIDLLEGCVGDKSKAEAFIECLLHTTQVAIRVRSINAALTLSWGLHTSLLVLSTQDHNEEDTEENTRAWDVRQHARDMPWVWQDIGIWT